MKRQDRTIRKAGGGSSLAERRELMKKQRSLSLLKQRMGEPASMQDDGLEVADHGEGVAGMNKAVAAIAKERKSKNKLSGEELEKWKANRKRVQEIRERQADAGYYTVLVFDSSGQCTAFLDELVKRAMIPRGGDLFIDGRILAHSMGITLPAPEYEMTTSVALSKGAAKTMAKIPKGYSA